MLGLIPFRFNNNGEKNTGVTMNDWLQDFFNDDFYTGLSTKGSFKTDIKDTPEEYIIHAELPGLKKEDINISYNNNYLTISATRKEEHEEKDHKYIRHERETGEVSREFYIDNINENSINAKYDNGILTVRLPKVEHKVPEAKKITIE